ncbi:MAG: alpha/beta hydrolase [Bacteroidales bacterium]|jgi:pimeloyl-ACP methyl ester carboxylesterase|nr:alpha/beta hydrolase [Bacteroidales bacterium]
MEFFSTVNGLPVHISDSKKGERVLVLLHGYLETLYIWEEFSSLFSNDFRIISIDLPGHGLSPTAPVNTMELCAKTLNSVLDKLKIDKALLVGHSMGGYVAIEALKQNPERYSGLVLMHSTPFADLPERSDERKREISLIRQNKLTSLVKLSVPKMFANQNVARMEEKILEIIEICEVHDPEGIAASVEGMMLRVDNTSFLNSCDTPILVICGKHDNYITVEACDKMRVSLPKADFVVLENSGHCSFLEEPKLSAQAISLFYSKQIIN